MKPLALLVCAAALAGISCAGISCAAPAAPAADAPRPDKTQVKTEPKKEPMSLHDFTMLDITGKERKLSEFKGETVLVVNTASHCGFTPQFDGLEKLYQAYKEKGFVILGFPSNDFGAQDPGTNAEIATFCKANYGVTFPMFSKIVVKGDGQHPLYHWLTSKDTDPSFAGPIGWNFTKFLVNKEGVVVARFESKITPGGPEIKSALEKELG